MQCNANWFSNYTIINRDEAKFEVFDSERSLKDVNSETDFNIKTGCSTSIYQTPQYELQ